MSAPLDPRLGRGQIARWLAALAREHGPKCVRPGPFPACDLEDALHTMKLVDQISETV